MFDCLKQDLGRCGHRREILLNPGMWAVASYRFRRWLFRLRAPVFVKWPLKLVATAADLASRIASGVELPTETEIGPGLYVPHAGYVVVSVGVRIGRHCTLTQGVTIGHARGGRANVDGCPVIGDRVYIGPGAIIIGPIRVGNDALIGAGAVVAKSVPAAGVVAGNPARLLSHAGSFELISYPHMQNDRERAAALAQSLLAEGKRSALCAPASDAAQPRAG